MKCPHGQAENREGAEFCRKCGQSLQVDIVCPQCGHVNLPDRAFCEKCAHSLEKTPTPTKPHSKKSSTIEHASFTNGRYQFKKLLCEGDKKKVYLAHDTQLDREVAFTLIKTETPELAIVRS